MTGQEILDSVMTAAEAAERWGKELSRNKLNKIAEDKFAWARMRKEA